MIEQGCCTRRPPLHGSARASYPPCLRASHSYCPGCHYTEGLQQTRSKCHDPPAFQGQYLQPVPACGALNLVLWPFLSNADEGHRPGRLGSMSTASCTEASADTSAAGRAHATTSVTILDWMVWSSWRSSCPSLYEFSTKPSSTITCSAASATRAATGFPPYVLPCWPLPIVSMICMKQGSQLHQPRWCLGKPLNSLLPANGQDAMQLHSKPDCKGF